MAASQDNYSIYYADKLWNLLPAIYRALDTDQFNANGPLRELVNRIGAQAATLRRSIDRLWEDQSIESCDDWVISYIAALLATNLVSSVDARGQRLDVAKTIYYRRRKGTVAILEEIAYDITGWDARVVEFFRRLSRTRHGLDPAIQDSHADPADDLVLQQTQGLVGTWTNTYIGGWADLRNAYGASRAQSPFSISPELSPPSAFDEYFHTADFRAGIGRSGWYKIGNLGIFVWRLQNFGTDQTTPVQNGNCYTFDPTGRQIPLFAASAQAAATSRPLQGSWDTWVSPQEWQLPTPISAPLLTSSLANPQIQSLYAALDEDGITLQPNSLGIFTQPGSFYELIEVSQITTYPELPGTSHQIMVFPESGQFAVLHPPLDGPVTVRYNYGFSAPIGAGPYDRRIIGQASNPTPAPTVVVKGGAGAFSASAVTPIGTVTLNDSLTYDSAPDFPGIQQLTVMAQNQSRPVIRLQTASPPVVAEWVFTGNGNSSLVLEGLFVSGGDIVLRGSFATVTLTCCTLDPGTSPSAEEMLAAPTAVFAQSIDGRDLTPTRLWIEGEVEQLLIDRSILGPIRTRGNDGEVETLTITNSIVQAIPTGNSPDLALAFDNGLANLSRCTVIGPAYVHRLEASECILDNLVTVENTQDGCIRFSATAQGSVIPRQYESVQIQPGAPLFTSRAFGQPWFAQLLDSVDNTISSGSTGATISAGAEDGSEMGVFASQANPIKERSLLVKYQEYMPLGLNPVIIHAT